VGPTGQVVAFEPGIENAALIRQNARVNRLANVTTVAAAVTDRDGWATFLDKGSLESRLDKDDDELQARRHAKQAQKGRVHGQTTVPVVTLDAWIAQTKQRPPDLIKFDVQGAEIGALRGMSETLRTAKPTLIIELHSTGAAVAELLESVGYEHAPIESPLPTREAPWSVHVLARPASGGGAADLSA